MVDDVANASPELIVASIPSPAPAPAAAGGSRADASLPSLLFFNVAMSVHPLTVLVARDKSTSIVVASILTSLMTSLWATWVCIQWPVLFTSGVVPTIQGSTVAAIAVKTHSNPVSGYI